MHERSELLRIYKTMLLIRRFEEQAVAFYKSGDLRGSLHPCIGQEATAVGAVFALRQDDYLTCTYRGHGQAIAKGLDPKEGMAELLGRATGCSLGKGGSMHYTDLSIGLLGENAIVGAGAPIAVGAALTAKTLKTGGRSVRQERCTCIVQLGVSWSHGKRIPSVSQRLWRLHRVLIARMA